MKDVTLTTAQAATLAGYKSPAAFHSAMARLSAAGTSFAVEQAGPPFQTQWDRAKIQQWVTEGKPLPRKVVAVEMPEDLREQIEHVRQLDATARSVAEELDRERRRMIKELRGRGLSQAKVAALLHMPQQRVNQIESAKSSGKSG